MKSTNEILKRIREMCGLEKLEFGCEIVSFKKGTGLIVAVQKYENGESDCYDVVYHKLPSPILERSPFHNWEIIGLPVELNHLLMAINKIKNGDTFGTLATNGWFHFNRERAFYDTSLTVEQNLNQNDELRAFISELIFK